MTTVQSEWVLKESGLDVVGRRSGGGRSLSETRDGSAAATLKDGGGFPQSVISAAREGDGQAFQGLVEGHWGSAVRLACSIMQTEEAAADAVQEALINLNSE